MSYERHAIPLLNRSLFSLLAALVLAGGMLAGCDSAGSSSGDGSEVEVGFGSATSSSTTSSATLAKADAPLEVTGGGDTLTIDDIRFIVSDVELEGDADSSEFETEKPAFVDLPLNSSDVVSIVSDQVPPGTYTKFKFEVEDANLDESDEEDQTAIDQLQSDIQDAGFTDWPGEASLVVVGNFNGTAFTTYFDAEIEVEIEMENQPFEVGGDDPSRKLTVNLSPSSWFTTSSGNPLDLSADQYQNVQEPVELEIEFEKDSEIEFDD